MKFRLQLIEFVKKTYLSSDTLLFGPLVNEMNLAFANVLNLFAKCSDLSGGFKLFPDVLTMFESDFFSVESFPSKTNDKALMISFFLFS